VGHIMCRLSLIKEDKDFAAFPRDSMELASLGCDFNFCVLVISKARRPLVKGIRTTRSLED